MSVINDVLLAVIGMAEEVLYPTEETPKKGETRDPFTVINIGALPADDKICMSISGGWPEHTFNDKGMEYELNLVLNGKHSSQQTVSNALNDIHQGLTQTKDYPQDTDYQITNIETTASPNYIGREENKQYLYGSSLKVRFYYRKD